MFVISNRILNDYPGEVRKMNTKKTLFTTLALGAAYLLKNKDARDKLMSGFQSFSNQVKSKRSTGGSV